MSTGVHASTAVAYKKAAALLRATVGKASRQNPVTPSKRVDRFQVLSKKTFPAVSGCSLSFERCTVLIEIPEAGANVHGRKD